MIYIRRQNMFFFSSR